MSIQRESKRVLVCPLNWGLGHATRDISIIKHLLEAGHNVSVAGEQPLLTLLSEEFPMLPMHHLGGYRMKYSERSSQVVQMLLFTPVIIWWTIKEHFLLRRLLKRFPQDVVISDNRYGLWNSHTKNIFITHQLYVLTTNGNRFIEKIVWRLLRNRIKKFDECWIPDNEPPHDLAGDLVYKRRFPSNAKLIGNISRFENLPACEAVEFKYDLMAIISGPEPHRTILEQRVIDQAETYGIKTLVLGGTPAALMRVQESPFITWQHHFPTVKMAEAICQSKRIICRSGYSGIMDFVFLNKPAIFIPTPGQTEQEYLCKYLSEKIGLIYAEQGSFDLSKLLEKEAIGFRNAPKPQTHLLLEVIKGL